MQALKLLFGPPVDHEPIIVVAGFLRCGMATTMAMLEAGGVAIAGGAHPPTYELPQTAHKLEGFIRGAFGPYGLADAVLAQMPAPVLELGVGISDLVCGLAWAGGQVRKSAPHCAHPARCSSRNLARP